jgi:hypothetical protein
MSLITDIAEEIATISLHAWILEVVALLQEMGTH